MLIHHFVLKELLQADIVVSLLLLKLDDKTFQYEVQIRQITRYHLLLEALALQSDTVRSISICLQLFIVLSMECVTSCRRFKTVGFRSMVVDQFTGISLQKDDNLLFNAILPREIMMTW